MEGWKREKPGVYVKVMGGRRYEVMRYFLPGRLTYGRWLVYGSTSTCHIPAFWDLRGAQLFAEEDAAAAPHAIARERE